MLKAILALFSGTAAGQAIMLAAAPILTRIYAPEEFGVLGIFSSYLAILTLVACLRFELAIPLPKSDRSAWGIVALCGSVISVVSILVAAVIGAFGDWLLPRIGAESLRPYAWLLPVGLFFSASYQVATQLALRYREYSSLARTRVLQASLGALVQIGAGLGGFGVMALLAGQVISVGSGSLRLARVLGVRARGLAHEINAAMLKQLAGRYRSFAWLGSPAALLNGLSLNLPTILIASLYDAVSAGQFFLAQRVLNLPLMLISSAISQSYMGEASMLHRAGDHGIHRLFWRLAFVLTAFALVGSLCIYFLSPSVFRIVFGENWSDSGVFASLLACYLGVRFVTTSLAPTLVIYERQDLSLMLQVLSALAVVLSFGLAWSQNLAPFDAVLLYSVMMTTPYIVGFYFLSRIIARCAGTP